MLNHVPWARFVCLCLCAYASVLPFGEVVADPVKVQGERLIIGLDLSQSNPLVTKPLYAQKLAKRVGDQIRGLPLRSLVLIRTFGDSDGTRNTLRIDEVVSARNRPETIAASVELLIASVPQLVSDGRLEMQPSTHIIAFIKTMHLAIGECRTPTTFILLSDGLEDSEYARLKNPGAHLPPLDIRAPQDKRFKCDELQILGLGEGLPRQSDVDHLRDEWQNWASGDGPFQRFSGLRDW